MSDKGAATPPAASCPRPPRPGRFALRSRPALAAALFLALAAAAVLTTAVFPTFDFLNQAALWGLVLLVSFAGWGDLIGRLAFPDQRADLGLRLAWGMAAVMALGGVACLASLATRAGLLGVTVVGIALQYRALRRGAGRDAPAPRRPAVTTLVLALVALLAGVQYYGSTAGAQLQSDDYQSYLVYPEKILATGTLIEPFSVRRLAAYGGQSLLHALTLIGTADVLQVPLPNGGSYFATVPNVLQVPLLDMGICLVVVLALVIGERGRARPGLWLLPVLLVLTLPNIRANSTSLMSGVVFFLALFRTASAPAWAARPRRGAAVLGLLAAAAATLRQSYIIPAAAFLAILYAPAVIGALRLPRAARWRRLAESAVAPAVMLFALLPWALLSYRSSGTALFPLFDGNYRPEYGRLTSGNPAIDRGAFLWLNIRHCYPVRSVPLFLLAALLIPWRRTRGALPALTYAALLGFVAIVWAFPLSDEWSMARYYFAFVVAMTLAVSMHVCLLRWVDWQRDPFGIALPALLVMAAIAFQVPRELTRTFGDYVELADGIGAVDPSAPLRQAQTYWALQASIPPRAPLFVMLDRPYWLDFQRNPIAVLDLPGYVSPPPGMPLDDDEALARYLQVQGFRFLAFVRSTRSECVYGRGGWERMLQSPLWGKAVPLVLKVFDRFESLMTSRVRLYDDGNMVVLDLATRTTDTGRHL